MNFVAQNKAVKKINDNYIKPILDKFLGFYLCNRKTF